MKHNVHLQATSRANLLRLRDTLLVPTRVRGALYLLANFASIHFLPATDFLHDLEELRGRLCSIHISSDVGVVNSPLLEDAHAVVVLSHSIMVILERSGDLLVGVNKNVRLEVVLASFCVVIFQLNVYVKTHLNKSG